ncbi:hypothetical protein BS50DRAFT_492624 [Corynespora cassiicola Philippines]|uniref:Uncharacterized protein n=1 Tax=Corynespora cassiicola Philippines TaxID=1448308 RepID=A0A2T2NRS1_CORCC|nr:hypothetical protein BS50DRAFT_492624 [Corynespora cassiicola Philippines]
MTKISPNRGFPILAYPKCDTSSPVSLSLIFKHDEALTQATLCLLSPLFIDAHEDRQTFILQYDAENIVPGSISLGPAVIPLPQDRLKVLAREGDSQIRTLSLTLRKVCPVWCMLPSRPLRPRSGCEAPFHQLAKLAQALELHVVFDYNRLHYDHLMAFQQLLKHPEQLSGFPVGQYYRQKQYTRMNWSVFGIDDSDLPPAYTEPSGKRPRFSTSPTLSSPPPKQARLLPGPEGTYTSPTDKDSTPTPSPKLQHSITPSAKSPPIAILSPGPPCSPAAPTALSASLYKRLGNRIEGELGGIYAQTLSHANYLQKTAYMEFEEELEDSRLQFGIDKQDAVYEVQNQADQTLQALTEDCENLVEYVEEKANQKAYEVVDRTSERLDELGQKVSLEREREELKRDKEELRKDKEELRKDKEELRKDKEELRRDKEGLRRDKKRLRRDRENLQNDQMRFESEKRAVKVNGRGEQGNRAGSAPA